MNESSNSFDILPPALDKHIPLIEELLEALTVDDALLGELYSYH